MITWGQTQAFLGRDTTERPCGTPFWAQHFYHKHEDVLGGFIFRPMLSVHTPLEVLELNGRQYSGEPEAAPRLARDEHGVWVPRLRVWENAGVPRPVREAEPVASVEAGPVMHDSYLSFLKQFRSCVESADPLADKLERLGQLPEQNPLYRSYWVSLRTNIPDFPRSVFERDVVQIDGVGRRLARQLVDSGLHIAKRVLTASDSELLSVPGLGRRVLRSIRRHSISRR